ncbi:MAG: outer membrane beta-barrel protein [Gemmatimonadaceae bacterium]|nr:outer membrane beta-barrel protein [Gemmatimonadaceae bacterium]
MNVSFRILAVTGAIAAFAPPAQAQLVYVGVRAGAGIPTGSFAETGQGASQDPYLKGANPGLGYGLDAGVGLGPLGVYAGLDHINFGCQDQSCASSGKYKLSGISAGVRLGVPLIPLIKPWVKAGITLNEMTGTVGGSATATKITTDRRPGYELGAGVDIPVMVLFNLTPQVRYIGQKLKYSATSAGVTTRGEKRADYYTFDLGFRLRSPF